MVSFVTAASRSSLRSFNRFRNASAAVWLFLEGRKKRKCFGCLFCAAAFVIASCNTAPTPLMPSPPAGPVPARMMRRTRSGRSCAMTCAEKPPKEYPRRSTLVNSRASTKVIASLAISATSSGVLPPEPPTPRLSKTITRWFFASPSTVAGSQSSALQHCGQMVEKDDGDAPLLAYIAIREARAVDIHRFGWGRVEGRGHGFFSPQFQYLECDRQWLWYRRARCPERLGGRL